MECFVALPNSVVIEIEADLRESGQYCIDQVRLSFFFVRTSICLLFGSRIKISIYCSKTKPLYQHLILVYLFCVSIKSWLWFMAELHQIVEINQIEMIRP